MEPFSITCHSCAARLKVTRPELIDQTLACPKCGSMINVQHPTGWKPPIPESKGSLSALSSVVSGNDFDQIEDLLPKPGEKVQISPTPNAKTVSNLETQPEKSRFQNPVPPTNTDSNQTGPAQDQPILPGQQWSNPSTQQRKKLMLMIGSAIATVLLVAITIVSIVRLGGETSDPDGGADQVAVGTSTEPSSGDSTPPPATDASVTQPDSEKPNDDNHFLEETTDAPQLPIEQKTNFDPAPPVNLDGPRFTAPTIPIDSSEPPVVDNPPAIVPDVENASGSSTASDSKSLQDLLLDRGILVGELADVATLLRSHEDSSRAKFSVKPVKTKNANFQRLLKLPIRKLDAPNGISLARAARTISQLSGVPITVDVRQLSLTGLPANPTLELALKDETTLSAAEKIAKLAGAQATVVGEGISISLPSDQQKTDFKLKFPNVGDLSDEEKQGFLNSIQALIAPADWNHPTAPATIRFEADTIVLNSSTAVHHHIKMLIARMNASAELTADPKNENAASAVVSRWAASEPLRTQPTRWKAGPDLTLASFLDRIERLHGLAVMVDWAPVRAAGWTSLVQVPGELVEKEVGEAILQLSKAMNLRVVGVDAKTLMLTTSQTANQSLDLEVYPLLADWAGQTKPAEIDQLMSTALGQQVQESFVRVAFEPKCRGLIVVAPQPIQHQVEKLIERLSLAKPFPQ